MLVTVENRGPETAPIHVVPQLWARNTWSWSPGMAKPELSAHGPRSVLVSHPNLPPLRLVYDGVCDLLFCENETNPRRMYGMKVDGYFKDAINDCVVGGNRDAVNPEHVGTKVGGHYRVNVPPGGTAEFRVRLSADGGGFDDFNWIVDRRRAEADEFYEAV